MQDESRGAPSSLDAYPAPWVVPPGRPKKSNKEKKEHRRKKSAREVNKAKNSNSNKKRNFEQKIKLAITLWIGFYMTLVPVKHLLKRWRVIAVAAQTKTILHTIKHEKFVNHDISSIPKSYVQKLDE